MVIIDRKPGAQGSTYGAPDGGARGPTNLLTNHGPCSPAQGAPDDRFTSLTTRQGVHRYQTKQSRKQNPFHGCISNQIPLLRRYQIAPVHRKHATVSV
jgi:hypothetical protein